MTRRILTVMFVFLSLCLQASADGLEELRQALAASSDTQMQEKVYVHTDNSCYFVGDTLWYKAYVVTAGDFMPTEMSRILYVELLSPDGLLVERQNIIVSPNGYTCGQFALKDSLYSGYYELRAYTRWQLNFGVRHHRYSQRDTWVFYNKQMAADYYRIWDGLYSRVFPIYSKPEQAGDYGVRAMYQRPKTRLPRLKKDNLIVNFYPEGGHLIKGMENRVAFEVTDQHGEALNLTGTVTAEKAGAVNIQTEYMGRGSFLLTPGDKRLKAHFVWKDKHYDIALPKAEETGVAMRLDNALLTLAARGLPADRQYAVSVICRGVLRHFERVPQLSAPGKSSDKKAGKSSDKNTGDAVATVQADIPLPIEELPSGVCDVTLFNDEGKILADRLFFVNNHEHDDALITAPIETTTTYQPYERIEMPVQCHGVTEPTNISLAIRDTNTDEPSYDTENLLTSMLLSSELRGFIAYPDYYFQSDDDQHRRHLDLLMMVQGWRKYKWEELADTARQMRYEPEKSMTVEGSVYKMLSLNPVEPDEITDWQDGKIMLSQKDPNFEENQDPFAESSDNGEGEFVMGGVDQDAGNSAAFEFEMGDIEQANDELGVNHGGLRHEVLVEAEISVDGQFAGTVQKTENGGHFLFHIPPFYGNAYLNMKAYKEKDSLRKNMASRKDATILDEEAYPDFYVKRDVFFPVFTHDYTYYEKHQPDVRIEELVDTFSELSMENDLHQLAEVKVKGHRRGRRAIDWKRPAFVVDAYDMYNDMTDRGLSFGMVDMRMFPIQVCRYLFGNMNRHTTYHVDGRIDGATYYRNYSPVSQGATDAELAGVFRANRTSQSLYRKLRLSRLQDIRVFSDYEPRTEDSLMVEERYAADATVELTTIPDDGRQVVFRDRHIVLHGFNMPEDFYQPDYSGQQPDMPADYRRTLYWNPNAITDENGQFTAVFYNNGKETRLKMTAAGVTSDGRLLHNK